MSEPAAVRDDGRARITRRALNTRLLRWHAKARRPLLIRDAATPWEILVAEVMSQQTGVDRVGPAWRRFIDRWPSAEDLSDATTHHLLAEWSGLGYNRRALRLREAARSIVTDHGGRVPETVDALERLPGIGPYTARAVAAAAYGVPVAPLDVNTRRVLVRTLGEVPAARAFQTIADGLVSRRQPRRWVDAMMDLAAAVCTARSPRCGDCPVAPVCASRGAVVAVRPRPRSVPFPLTRRWLRGRLVRLLTDAPPVGWVELPGSLGVHGFEAIAVAAAALERDGVIELSERYARLRA